MKTENERDPYAISDIILTGDYSSQKKLGNYSYTKLHIRLVTCNGMVRLAGNIVEEAFAGFVNVSVGAR